MGRGLLPLVRAHSPDELGRPELIPVLLTAVTALAGALVAGGVGAHLRAANKVLVARGGGGGGGGGWGGERAWEATAGWRFCLMLDALGPPRLSTGVSRNCTLYEYAPTRIERRRITLSVLLGGLGLLGAFVSMALPS